MASCATNVRFTSLGRQLLTFKELMLKAQHRQGSGEPASFASSHVIATFIEDNHVPVTYVTQGLTTGQVVNDGMNH